MRGTLGEGKMRKDNLIWYENVDKIKNDELVEKLREIGVERRDRPKKTWEDGKRGDLREFRIIGDV